MDVRKVTLDFVAGRARVSVADQAGERDIDLDGERFAQLVDASQPLTRAILAEVRPRKPDPPGTPSDPSFWDQLYQIGGDGWELARPAPPLARFVASQDLAGLRTLVIGCGRGHDAELLARAGAQVTAIDFSAEAIAAARKRYPSLDFRVRDLFDLPRDPETYDLIVEHTCFCAIEPRRRDEYVAVMRSILRSGGRLVGLFYNHGREGGPPFTVDEAELRARFSGGFTIESCERPRDSVIARAGQEILMVLRRAG